MIKKILLALGSIIVVLPAVAQTVNLGLITHDFKAGKEEQFKSPLFFHASANCTVSVKHDKGKFMVRMLDKSAKLDGTKFQKGQTKIVEVKNHHRYHAEADGKAQVSITNISNNTIHIDCGVF